MSRVEGRVAVITGGNSGVDLMLDGGIEAVYAERIGPIERRIVIQRLTQSQSGARLIGFRLCNA